MPGSTTARVLLPAALTAALLLTGCAADGDAPAAEPTASASEQASARHNDADVMFAQMMIPHHEQAVEMARLAEGRAGDGVAELAGAIEAAQGPEIEQLESMLEAWGEEPESGSMDHGMPGMMSDEDMADLESATGDAFDQRFLELMIAHHEGAIEMAETEIDGGENPEAVALAEQVVEDQRAEIAQMTAMLGGSPSAGTGSDGGHGGH
ncbi:DUF305 domain-containing protein [Marinitenerispora sediminis]|uniref:DUF305 domain-containing protein n=2 Tax=Marinitenerispora sediminis TaxID=1931232 RepID=A0A368T7A8_9ACTN|nr:DUF305 domain-containing protein [Marinitenerispora sediminis]RCV57325.1 DUF305 domain-containing protein [Marinitenerispora sediminis]RCV59413.1 DUF305 domain-containing protein [Marinitenerispora sediminis]